MMSAFIVSKAHIDALVAAALAPGTEGPLRWFVRPMTDEEKIDAFQVGAPWGMAGPVIGRRLFRYATPEDVDRIGQMLLRENRVSVNHRYSENEVEDIYSYCGPPHGQVVDPVVILKALDCYEYQSCEHPGWDTSEAHAFCQALRRRMIRRLPGYEEAPWEIASPDEYLGSGEARC